MSCNEITHEDIRTGDLLMVTEMVLASKGQPMPRTSWVIVHDKKSPSAYTVELLDSLGLLALRNSGETVFAFHDKQNIVLVEGKHRDVYMARIRSVLALKKEPPKKTQWAKNGKLTPDTPAKGKLKVPGIAKRKQRQAPLLRKLQDLLKHSFKGD